MVLNTVICDVCGESCWGWHEGMFFEKYKDEDDFSEPVTKGDGIRIQLCKPCYRTLRDIIFKQLAINKKLVGTKYKAETIKDCPVMPKNDEKI